MRVGTKSLLFGVHQVLWHPVTVFIAWVWLYGAWPSWKELIAIVIHDWGYWGKPDMDGTEGETHPVWAADWMSRCFGPEMGDLCLLHSRHYCRQLGKAPSRLCWADKLSLSFEPRWFYLLRARRSGELLEYMDNTKQAGLCPWGTGAEDWHSCVRGWLIKMACSREAKVVPYVNPEKQIREAAEERTCEKN